MMTRNPKLAKLVKFISFGISLCILIAILALVTHRNILCFDMNSGKSRQEVIVLGMKLTEKNVNEKISKVSERLNLTNKNKKIKCFELDKSAVFYSQTNYSKNKSLYFELLGIAIMIESGSLEDTENQEANLLFREAWEKLAVAN